MLFSCIIRCAFSRARPWPPQPTTTRGLWYWPFAIRDIIITYLCLPHVHRISAWLKQRIKWKTRFHSVSVSFTWPIRLMEQLIALAWLVCIWILNYLPNKSCRDSVLHAVIASDAVVGWYRAHDLMTNYSYFVRIKNDNNNMLKCVHGFANVYDDSVSPRFHVSAKSTIQLSFTYVVESSRRFQKKKHHIISQIWFFLLSVWHWKTAMLAA